MAVEPAGAKIAVVSLEEHRRRAAERPAARCAVLVVSDTRTESTDASGRLAAQLLEAAGHSIVQRSIVPNDPTRLHRVLGESLQGGSDLVITIGGTGISPKDRTIETVRTFIARELPGFGELFRSWSLREIGTAVILTRALLGVAGSGTLLACLPGSAAAVRLALERILLPELLHLLYEVRKT